MGAVFSVAAAVIAFAMKALLGVSGDLAPQVEAEVKSSARPEDQALAALKAAQAAVNEALEATRSNNAPAR
jgi:hypothetical protein